MRRNNDVDDDSATASSSDQDASRPDEADSTAVNRRAVLKAVGAGAVGLPALADAAAAHGERDIGLIPSQMTDALLVTNSDDPDQPVLSDSGASEELAAATEDVADVPVEVRQTTVYAANGSTMNAALVEAQEPPADLPEDREQVNSQLADVLGETTETANQVIEDGGERALEDGIVIASSEPGPFYTPLKRDEVREQVQRVAQEITGRSVDSRPTVSTTLQQPKQVENCEEVDPALCEEIEKSSRNAKAPTFGNAPGGVTPTSSLDSSSNFWCWICYWVCYWNNCWYICEWVC